MYNLCPGRMIKIKCINIEKLKHQISYCNLITLVCMGGEEETLYRKGGGSYLGMHPHV